MARISKARVLGLGHLGASGKFRPFASRPDTNSVDNFSIAPIMDLKSFFAHEVTRVFVLSVGGQKFPLSRLRL